jgi:hypothetical protein
MKKITLTFGVFLIVLCCHKDSDFEFSGISEWDETGVLIGNYDKTDWRFDDIWNAREDALFRNVNFKSTESEKIQENYTSDYVTASKSMAFPNPAKFMLLLMIESNADTIKYVIVNNNYNIIFANKSSGKCTRWSIDVSDRKKYRANSIYRIYYKLEYINGDTEKGHGDIKIIN